jgi:hypothetical protein
MKRPAGLRMVLVVVCLCVIGCPFMTQGQRELPNSPPPPYEPTGFCPPGSPHAIDVETSNMGTWGSVQIEECVTTNILIGGVYVDRYGYRVTNNCSIDLCEFSLPNNTGANSPCYTSLSGWTCTVTSGWKWAAQSWGVSGIDPGSYGDFWIDVPTGTTVDAGVTGSVSFCFNQIANAVATTGPRSPLPNLVFTGVNDICCSGSCVWNELGGGTITVSATVKNIGQSTSAGCYAIVETLSTCVSGTNFPPPEYVPPLSPGGTWPVTWTWNPTSNSVQCPPSQGPGLFWCVLNIKVDVPDLVTESNENDNVGTCSVCCKLSRPDLTILTTNGTCTCVQGPLYTTCTITVSAIVKNIGTAYSNSCQAEIVDSYGQSHIEQVSALAPTQTTTVNWQWSFACGRPPCPCPDVLTATVDSAHTENESDETNNTVVTSVCCQ